MHTLVQILDQPVIQSLGWALLHFVWQATLITVVAARLRSHSSKAQYLMLCAALAVMVVTPVATWCWSFAAMKPTLIARIAQSVSAPASIETDRQSFQNDRLLKLVVVRQIENSNAPSATLPPSPSVGGMASESPSVVDTSLWLERLRHIVEPNLPGLVLVWLLGVLGLSFRLLVGWRSVNRLRYRRVVPASEIWQGRLNQLAIKLGIPTTIRLVESPLVDVPTVIGWLRPIILLPASFLSGLTTEQVEAVLAHELAHIRRHDFLVNLIQAAIEVLLFYHPAVWWLSRRIREEREHCCDDIAVAICGNRVTYARALATMEEMRSSSIQHATLPLTLAADGGSLLQRIRRLSRTQVVEAHQARGASLLAMSVIMGLGLTAYTISQAGTDAAIPSDKPSTVPSQDIVDSEVTTSAPLAADVEEDPLLRKLDVAIDSGRQRSLTANRHSPWQIFQGLSAFKQDFQIILDDRKIKAIDWISAGEPQFDNQPLLEKTSFGGKFHSFTRPYVFQGHPAQFLAVLAEMDLPSTFLFKVGNEQITAGQLVDNVMKEVNVREEVTWVLWSLQHYLNADARWMNQANEPWSIERLVQIETASPVIGAPNGGNDRLIALTRARDKHLKSGGQLVGIWAEADQKIGRYIELARSLQNLDGTFSSKFYERPGSTDDLNQRLFTSGLAMDFLSVALPDERLQDPWIRNAVAALSNDLIANRQRQIDCASLYRSLKSLITYQNRIRQMKPAISAVSAQPGPVKVAENNQRGQRSGLFDLR